MGAFPSYTFLLGPRLFHVGYMEIVLRQLCSVNYYVTDIYVYCLFIFNESTYPILTLNYKLSSIVLTYLGSQVRSLQLTRHS